MGYMRLHIQKNVMKQGPDLDSLSAI